MLELQPPKVKAPGSLQAKTEKDKSEEVHKTMTTVGIVVFLMFNIDIHVLRKGFCIRWQQF